MNLDLICTFHTRPQEFINVPILDEILSSKTTLMNFIMGMLKKVEVAELVKISCCVQSDKMPPQWFININGKFWLNDIEGYRYVHGIKSKVPIQYVVEWLNENNESLTLNW